MPVTTQDCSGLVALFLRHGLLPHTDTRPFWLPTHTHPASRACLQSEGGHRSQQGSLAWELAARHLLLKSLPRGRLKQYLPFSLRSHSQPEARWHHSAPWDRGQPVSLLGFLTGHR